MMYGCSDIAGDGHAMGFEGRVMDVYRLSQGHHIKSVKNLTTFKILIDFQKAYRLSKTLSTIDCHVRIRGRKAAENPGSRWPRVSFCEKSDVLCHLLEFRGFFCTMGGVFVSPGAAIHRQSLCGLFFAL